MSATSIQDQGYTPPDFLQKLFRKTSASSSENLFKPLSTISNFRPTHYFSSSPMIPINQVKCSPSKLLRTHSFVQDQRISTKKFKIFYNAFMEGAIPEVQASQIWQKFERSLSNPFQYDKFIQQLRTLKQTQRQSTNKIQPQIIDVSIDKTEQRSNSYERLRQRNKAQPRSLRKQISDDKHQKQKMKKAIGYVRGIIKHGEKFIRGR